MSYDESTGWTKLTARQVSSYCRAVAPERRAVEWALGKEPVDHYWDAYGGLHARCDQTRLWELLSGMPSTWELTPTIPPSAEEFISVTDLGAVFDPPAGTSEVLRLLRTEGLLERINGKDHPTIAAQGLYLEREAAATIRFPHKPGATQRLWAYPVVERLRQHRTAIADARAERESALRPAESFSMELKFPASCDICGTELSLGRTVTWTSPSGEISCATHSPSPVDEVSEDH